MEAAILKSASQTSPRSLKDRGARKEPRPFLKAQPPFPEHGFFFSCLKNKSTELKQKSGQQVLKHTHKSLNGRTREAEGEAAT